MKLKQPGFAKKKSRSQKMCFFRVSLVKSANSTSLPRFSSLQIDQMHTIHITKNALRLEGPSSTYCDGNLPAFKKKNLRDPGPQAFGFLQ